MPETWNLFVVDDEPDVHQVTTLALKHRFWRKRGFSVTSANSKAQAIEMLQKDSERFHVAIIDVVMESDDAGLELCKYIRLNCPSSLRIVLRTGQPGVAPEEYVLNEFDIDYYLSKAEATPERLYSIARACLRSSQDISTLVAFGKQLQSFSRALQNVSSLDDLLVFMAEGLRFLELKHSAATIFVHDSQNNSAIAGNATFDTKAKALEVCDAVRKAESTKMAFEKIHPGKTLNLPDNAFLIPFQATLEDPAARDKGEGEAHVEKTQYVNGGLYVELKPELVTEKSTRDFWADAMLFIDNWKIAYATLRLQERLSRERMLREKMYYERLQSIATMVTGVAHEMNTPLGVANTAGSMIASLAKTLGDAKDAKPETKEITGDLVSSSDLLMKNLSRAHDLVRSFKQLSASQLSDQRSEMDIVGIVKDCVATMIPETKKRKLKIEVKAPTDNVLLWNGYPGHLTQVVVNFIQNTLRYAYNEGEEGLAEVRISRATIDNQEGFHIEYQDHGKGVAPEIFPRLFEPFVTSGRSKGGTGLGLAITHNIITNLLHGKITCTSVQGKGTTFVVDIPATVPETKKEGAGALGAFQMPAAAR